jgi:hypothetical protein
MCAVCRGPKKCCRAGWRADAVPQPGGGQTFLAVFVIDGHETSSPVALADFCRSFVHVIQGTHRPVCRVGTFVPLQEVEPDLCLAHVTAAAS